MLLPRDIREKVRNSITEGGAVLTAKKSNESFSLNSPHHPNEGRRSWKKRGPGDHEYRDTNIDRGRRVGRGNAAPGNQGKCHLSD